MSVYIVRLTHNQEFVGIFYAESLLMLADLIDHCCDPADCQYARLPEGGLFDDQHGAQAIPFFKTPEEGERAAESSEDYPTLFHRGISYTGEWGEALDGDRKLNWKALA